MSDIEYTDLLLWLTDIQQHAQQCCPPKIATIELTDDARARTIGFTCQTCRKRFYMSQANLMTLTDTNMKRNVAVTWLKGQQKRLELATKISDPNFSFHPANPKHYFDEAKP